MISIIAISDEEYQKCLDFATNSSPTQRENRSGGTQIRDLNMIQSDTMRGKIAEVAVKAFFSQEPFNISDIELDFGIYPRGVWDQQDMTISGQRLSVKSSKWFARWLLLETKDVARGDLYDAYIFVTVSQDFKEATIQGYALRTDILEDANTLSLRRGEPIPGTQTILDADNYARHISHLRKTERDWMALINPSA